MLNFSIRTVKIEDAPAINEIRRMDGVRENTLGYSVKEHQGQKNLLKGFQIMNTLRK